MSGVLTLSNNDLIILRDNASQYYLQAGQDADATTAIGRLIQGNVGLLQPSLYFQVHSTPVAGFWTITTVATSKFLKVDTSTTGNQNKLTWVDTNPSSDFVIDKSPYYFSFTQVPGYDTPVLYVLGTYYNGGMTLQQPDGAGSDLVFGLPQAIPGTMPELSFEVNVPQSPPSNMSAKAYSALDLNSPSGAAGAAAANNGAKSANLTNTPSSSGTGTNTVDPWAVAFIVLIAVLAMLALGYSLYVLYHYYQQRAIVRESAIAKSSPPPAKTPASESSNETPPPPPPQSAQSSPPPDETPPPYDASVAPAQPPPPAETSAATPPATSAGTVLHQNRRHSWQNGARRAAAAMPASFINTTAALNEYMPASIPASDLASHSGYGAFGFAQS